MANYTDNELGAMWLYIKSVHPVPEETGSDWYAIVTVTGGI